MTSSEAWDILKNERQVRVQKMLEGTGDRSDSEFVAAVDAISRNYDMMYTTVLRFGKIFK